jgi:hypothetical protein
MPPAAEEQRDQERKRTEELQAEIARLRALIPQPPGTPGEDQGAP